MHNIFIRTTESVKNCRFCVEVPIKKALALSSAYHLKFKKPFGSIFSFFCNADVVFFNSRSIWSNLYSSLLKELSNEFLRGAWEMTVLFDLSSGAILAENGLWDLFDICTLKSLPTWGPRKSNVTWVRATVTCEVWNQLRVMDSQFLTRSLSSICMTDMQILVR